MARLPRKRKIVKKKKRPVASKPAKKRSAKKVSKKKKPKAKTVKKKSKAKVKKRQAKRRRKKGVMRRSVEKLLQDPRSQAQILQRYREKLGPNVFLPGWEETDESLMMQRLIRAEQLGAFDNEANRLAREFDWQLRSVYELWHSPDVHL